MSLTFEALRPTRFTYSRWRHGGWYVHDVRYPSGARGCVSDNYADKQWRIACDPRPFDDQPTFRTRDEAAAAEWELVQALRPVEVLHDGVDFHFGAEAVTYSKVTTLAKAGRFRDAIRELETAKAEVVQDVADHRAAVPECVR